VNNAIHWAAVEDVLAGLGWRPAHAELEYHRPARPGCEPRLVATRESGPAWAWLLDGGAGSGGGRPLASARLDREPLADSAS
jgi:hypothetical protein